MASTSGAILALRPVTFHYKSDAEERPQFGLVAEEAAKVDPDLVVPDANNQIYTVRYYAVNAMFSEWVSGSDMRRSQSQSTTIAEQKKEIGALKARLDQVKTLASRLDSIDKATTKR